MACNNRKIKGKYENNICDKTKFTRAPHYKNNPLSINPEEIFLLS